MTISITIDERLLNAIDRVARESKRTRSDVCRVALRKWLESEREALLVREEQEAYRAHPVTPDEFDDLIAAQTIDRRSEE
jgi:metal-responsive CopG/Arc/MetJ family transcriptional regulator